MGPVLFIVLFAILFVSLFVLFIKFDVKGSDFISAYRIMNNSEKVNFWVITTNVFLVVVSFWLGLWIQDYVASKNAKYNSYLTQFQLAELTSKIYKPLYSPEVCIMLYDLNDLIPEGYKDLEKTKKEIHDLWKNKREVYVKAALHVDSICGAAKYYLLNNDTKGEIGTNNGIIEVFCALDGCLSNPDAHPSRNEIDSIIHNTLRTQRFMYNATKLSGAKSSKIVEDYINEYRQDEEYGEDLLSFVDVTIAYAAVGNIMIMDKEFQIHESKSIWKMNTKEILVSIWNEVSIIVYPVIFLIILFVVTWLFINYFAKHFLPLKRDPDVDKEMKAMEKTINRVKDESRNASQKYIDTLRQLNDYKEKLTESERLCSNWESKIKDLENILQEKQSIINTLETTIENMNADIMQKTTENIETDRTEI